MQEKWTPRTRRLPWRVSAYSNNPSPSPVMSISTPVKFGSAHTASSCRCCSGRRTLSISNMPTSAARVVPRLAREDGQHGKVARAAHVEPGFERAGVRGHPGEGRRAPGLAVDAPGEVGVSAALMSSAVSSGAFSSSNAHS